MLKNNCLSYALKLENENISSSELDLWYSYNPFSEISEKCENVFHRTCRKVEADEELLKGEWKVVFFGFEVKSRDYDGHPKNWDYHFARQEEDGSWKERYSIGEPITKTDLETLTSHYKVKKLSPLFLAIGKK